MGSISGFQSPELSLVASVINTVIIYTMHKHLLIGPEAYQLELIKLHVAWPGVFFFSPDIILVTKLKFHRIFPYHV